MKEIKILLLYLDEQEEVEIVDQMKDGQRKEFGLGLAVGRKT